MAFFAHPCIRGAAPHRLRHFRATLAEMHGHCKILFCTSEEILGWSFDTSLIIVPPEQTNVQIGIALRPFRIRRRRQC